MSTSLHSPRGRAGLRRAVGVGFVAAVFSSRAHAFDQPKEGEWDREVQQQIQQKEIVDSLAAVARAFGPSAVVLQAALLNEAVRNGSVLEAKVEVPEFEDRDGRHYAAFTLESGIVYNDNGTSTDDRVRRTWREIVASALHRLTELEIDRAEGVAVKVGYHHRPYENERQLRDELPAGRGEAEKMSYYIKLDDAVGLAKGTADPDEVLQRAVIVRGVDVVILK